MSRVHEALYNLVKRQPDFKMGMSHFKTDKICLKQILNRHVSEEDVCDRWPASLGKDARCHGSLANHSSEPQRGTTGPPLGVMEAGTAGRVGGAGAGGRGWSPMCWGRRAQGGARRGKQSSAPSDWGTSDRVTWR